MNPSYRLGPVTRWSLRALSSALKPQLEAWDPPIEDRLLEVMERDLRLFPTHARLGFIALVHLLSFGGLLVGALPVPLPLRGPEGRRRAMDAFQHSRVPLFRLALKGVKTFVMLASYALPEVEEKLGLDQRAWRADRIAFRQKLLAADALLPELPPRPQAIGSQHVLADADYLTPGAWKAAPTTEAEP